SLTGNAWEAYCEDNENGPEMLWSLDFPGGLLEAELHSLNGLDHDLVLLESCDPSTCLQMPFLGGESELLSNVLPAGEYFLAVDLWNWTPSSDPAQGLDYSLALSCDPEPCSEFPPLLCAPPLELEPNGGWDDDNAFYNEIACGDTVCGLLWADGGNRDLDWFRLEHEGGPLRLGVEVEGLNPILYLTDFALPDEGGVVRYNRDRNPFCEGEELLLADLAPGSYYAVVSHNALLGVPAEQPYRLWLGCPEDPCEAHEPPVCSGQEETEPNEGWNSGNQNWNDWNGVDPFCGTVSAGDGERDTDWFRFELSDSSSVALGVDVADFDPILFLADAVLPPAGVIHSGADNRLGCQPESLRVACLPPGAYYAMVAPAGGAELPEPQNYALRIHIGEPGPCPEPCADLTVIQDLELPWEETLPAPALAHQQRPWLCEEINSGGADDVYELQLSQAMELRIGMQGLDPRADEVLLLLDGCGEAAQCLNFADDFGPGEGGEVLQTSTLAAGSYTLVADFWSSLESHPYTLSIEPLSAVSQNRTQLPVTAELRIGPNPFNPRTLLEWEHPGGGGELVLYSIDGRRVHRVILQETPAGPRHHPLDGSGLATGLYIVRLAFDSGPPLQTKALLLK
ncbi:MAG: T9SS type A sorting domain-containing protein, partial [Candidatus Cloacimonetes bacterium]|nr:T9SS type A sorting domain-containing protein [Candidatus Cloacimonadota bacterium]